ncbi:putative EF-hand domain-containing protein [Helianthus annuus]|nr:putative EF-hand domain-containing protein [Helianthus annuus]KAJ0798608.1 putative EF-hand domain-containing protein [Helianthus annuus]
MSIEIIDSHMVEKFIENSEAFEKIIGERFTLLDANKDGVLSRGELQNDTNDSSYEDVALQPKEEIINLYDVLFEKFDVGKKGTLDRKEFGSLMKEVMLAKAHGFGDTPVSIILQEDSLLKKVF